MNQSTLQLITPVINLIIVAILGYLGKEVVKLVPVVIDFIVAKVGLTNYEKAKAIGWDIWEKIEEDGRLNKLIDTKGNVFITLIKKKIPGITDDEIDLIKQAIAGEFNKDKPLVVKELETPTVAITPIKKYYDDDGNELVKANAVTADNTTAVDENVTAANSIIPDTTQKQTVIQGV